MIKKVESKQKSYLLSEEWLSFVLVLVHAVFLHVDPQGSQEAED